jgi:hypothetical protein
VNCELTLREGSRAPGAVLLVAGPTQIYHRRFPMDCMISREELLDKLLWEDLLNTSEVLEEADIELLMELHAEHSTVTDANTATGLDS